MRKTFAIALREISACLQSPLAVVFLFFYLLLNGFLTFMASGFFKFGELSAEGFFFWHPWLSMAFAPAIGMRLWAEERHQGTMELLLSLPVSVTQAVLGKFLAGWFFLALGLLLTFPFPLTLLYLGSPDMGPILTGYLGSFLLAGVCLSVSCAASACTRSQTISFITSFTACLLLVLAGYPPIVELLLKWGAGSGTVDFIASFSLTHHFEALRKGVVDLRDILYFIGLIVFGLCATGTIIRERR